MAQGQVGSNRFSEYGQDEDMFDNKTKTQIANLQKFLQKTGYYPEDAKIDSIAGPITRKAYYEYMEDPKNRLRNSGWLGKDKEGNRKTPVRDAASKIWDFIKGQ